MIVSPFHVNPSYNCRRIALPLKKPRGGVKLIMESDFRNPPLLHCILISRIMSLDSTRLSKQKRGEEGNAKVKMEVPMKE